jgi:hypothetical protein
MAIDSVRLLTDSAAQLWRRLDQIRPMAAPRSDDGFEAWLGVAQLDQGEEQALRRDYRRLLTLIDEIGTLVRSRSRALELVREEAEQG